MQNKLRIAATGVIWLWLSIIVIAIDRYTKILAIDNLNLHDPYPILPIFNLTLAYNTGAAFSFLDSASGWQNILFSTLAILISVALLIWLYKTPAKSYWKNIAFSLVIAGALGNAWDRLTYGFVVDFLDFHSNGWHFAIFNVADSAICIAAFMLMLLWVRQEK